MSSSDARAADPLADYLEQHTRTLAREAARRRDAELIAAIAARVAPPFRPTVRILTSPDRPSILTLVIGEAPGGYVRADVDVETLERFDPEAIAAALLKAGRHAFARFVVPVEDHIERGTE